MLPLLSLLLPLLLPLLPSLHAANIPALPSGWTYVGCLYEGDGQRILNQTYYWVEKMTLSICVQYCASQGMPMAALEAHDQCFCGKSLTYVQPVDDAICNYTCPGDTSQMCGGWGYMTLFSLASQDPRISAGLISSSSTKASSTSAAAATTTPAASSSASPSQVVVTSVVSAQGETTTVVVTNGNPSSTSLDSSGSAPSPGAASLSLSSSDTSSDAGSSISPSSSASSSDGVGSSSEASSGTGGSSGAGGSTASTGTTQPSLPTASAAATGGSPRFKDSSQAVVFGVYASSGALSTLTTAIGPLGLAGVLGGVALGHLGIWTLL
ncbi:hypothetical protein IAT38_000526 [Cryptococcus sp. DSM 104549]